MTDVLAPVPPAAVAVLAAACAAVAVLVWPRSPSPWRPRVTRSRPGARQQEVPSGAADVLELLALALAGGAPVPAALKAVASVLPERQAGALAAVATGVDGSADAEHAWAGAPASWMPARRALQLAHEAGVPPGPLLSGAAQDVRREALAQVEVATARLSVQLVVPLGLAFLPAFVLTTVVPVVLALAGDLLP